MPGLRTVTRVRPQNTRVEHATASARSARLRARAPRIAFIAVTAVLSLAGARQVIAPRHVPAQKVVVPAATVDQASHGFALQFTRAYLSYDASDPAARQAALAPFEASGADPDGGYSPPQSGARSVLWADVVQDQKAIAGGRIVTIAAQLTSETAPVYLAVPVRRDQGGALQLGGYPSLVGAPAVGGDPPPTHTEVNDAGLRQVSARAVSNYLARDKTDLDADLADQAVVTLPSVALRVTGTDTVLWADKGGTGVLVTVNASDRQGGEATLTYELGVVRKDRWQVTSIEVVPTKT